jgi:hypothetical protein
MTIVFESSYCNVYGTEHQLRYVYRNNGSGIAVEYITGTSNLYQIWGRHMDPPDLGSTTAADRDVFLENWSGS